MDINRSRFVVASLAAVTGTYHAYADSLASYPEDWREWPIVKESMNLPADTILPEDASLFMQESVRAYSWINNGQGSPLTIRVNPAKLNQYQQHGPYTDGPTAVAISEVQGIVWVTEHIGGEAIYGSYDRQGKDISHTHPTLKPSFCHSCHTTYKDICINGTCANPQTTMFD
ncbi:hypothetical protein VISI1226_18291 [Vibrio sinaloensis DSM 21326]|uniref:Cytochrome P460 domain-containing protein n=1 Tax=Vibrio sinaloensis DSM 21326 TaxID=945550 RepID=E8M912_PHOS4|nr:hypothetical protein [Vibrio sinaloensis]EGA69489.1 hypothetical protein VISI1226_18291 [Vibrio sinaloensis DSM 21326]